jgi:uncharacterized tellurite resistance protein B-like protein
MLSRIRRYFADHLEAAAPGSAKATSHAADLAAAALMVEVARSDFDYAESERQRIAALIVDSLAVSGQEVAELQSLAEAEVEQAVSLHQFTRLVHEHYDEQAKQRLMEALWRVALADGEVDKHEAHVIRRVADLLYISQEVYVRSREVAESEG